MSQMGFYWWVQGSGFRVQGSGFRVSPWGVPLLDYDGKPHLNEKLEMRNAKWWCGA